MHYKNKKIKKREREFLQNQILKRNNDNEWITYKTYRKFKYILL